MTAYFSNGSEWDAWSADWCETCIHDAAGPEDGCPIILQLLLGEPTEHVERGPDWSPQTVAWCSQYEKRPKWHGEVVGDVVGGGLLVLIVDTEDDAEQSEHWDGTTPWESDALDGGDA